MKRVTLLLTLAALAVILTGCSTLEARYNASAAKSYAKAEEARAKVDTAHAAALETQAVQTTAQVAQVEASNRLMAFLATLTTISQNPSGMIFLLLAGGLVFGFLLLAAMMTGGNR